MLPGIKLLISPSPFGPQTTSTYAWSDAGEWLSAQPWVPRWSQTSTNIEQPSDKRRGVHYHIRRITTSLRTAFEQHHHTQLLDRLANRESINAYAKTALLYKKLQLPGSPLRVALDWVGPRAHRAAICALYGGELFLGRYAGNYYAKELIPSQRHQLVELSRLGIEPSRICLHCWHFFQKAHLEDETHALLRCPAYAAQRRDFLFEVSTECSAKISAQESDLTRINILVASQNALGWQSLGRFLARIRQIRRKMRIEFSRIAQTLAKLSFETIWCEWKQ